MVFRGGVSPRPEASKSPSVEHRKESVHDFLEEVSVSEYVQVYGYHVSRVRSKPPVGESPRRREEGCRARMNESTVSYRKNAPSWLEMPYSEVWMGVGLSRENARVEASRWASAEAVGSRAAVRNFGKGPGRPAVRGRVMGVLRVHLRI